ncbi:MAG: hypothetical protein PWP31_1657, partial [Clostridia bacterium]|nr:hypothetical protein [Clostridia bacterium]
YDHYDIPDVSRYARKERPEAVQLVALQGPDSRLARPAWPDPHLFEKAAAKCLRLW